MILIIILINMILKRRSLIHIIIIIYLIFLILKLIAFIFIIIIFKLIWDFIIVFLILKI